MFTGLQGQKILYTTSFVGNVCRKILVSIRAKLLECLGWLCMTLHLSFPSMYKARYKSTFWKIKLLGLAEAWSPRVFSSLYLSLSLPLPLFFRLIPWNTEALCVHFPAWASKTLLAFYVNQGISASFYFLIYNILSLSLSKSSTGAVSLLSSPGSSPAVCCCTSMIKCI